MSDTDSNYYRQLLSDELFNLSRSESLSEEGLREIIECDHQLRLNDNHHLVSDCDFFLEACINERFNEEIIQCLLEYFPAAASAAEEEGRRQFILHAETKM